MWLFNKKINYYWLNNQFITKKIHDIFLLCTKCQCTGYVYKLLQVMSFEQISEYRVKSRSYQSKLVAQEYGFNSLKELLKSIGLSRNTYQNRIMKGMPIKQALGLEN